MARSRRPRHNLVGFQLSAEMTGNRYPIIVVNARYKKGRNGFHPAVACTDWINPGAVPIFFTGKGQNLEKRAASVARFGGCIVLPILLDHKVLNSLPIPNDKAISRVFQTFQTIVGQKTIPFFRNHRGVNLVQLSNIRQNLFFRRMEDEEHRVGLLTLLVRSQQSWTVLIHERIFDYLAFVLPARPGPELGSGISEERKMTAFSEFFLRHHFEHILFPDKSEVEVVRSDIDFARGLSIGDPKTYAALRAALSDQMNGITGKGYLQLLDREEEDSRCDFSMGRIISAYTQSVAALPAHFLPDVFRDLDVEAKMRVLSHCYRNGLDDLQPLVRRAASLRKVLRLFAIAIDRDPDQGMELFREFKRRWGLATLFNELDIPEHFIEERSLPRLYDIFSRNLEEFVEPLDIIGQDPSSIHRQGRPEAIPQQPKSLKERIDEAKGDPDIPRPVVDLIEKNRMNAAGQSGAKYAELIETLLAVPWGKIKRIWVSPEEFEDGLNRSHYGLKKPKEIICDFFANLIWRYQHFKESEKRSWNRTGSALLFVGPPGVGKTSMAISIARNLGIPYHKLSLGGMKDEADIRGYGFTYEGSKPGPIIQGLIKMGVMNGMFIMDEADKTEKIAIATLLEILDPEQNHLFHDKYTQTTVDINLSNCHFVLTANSIENVPAAVVNRCEVIFLDRYSVEEKISIARDFLLRRIRDRYLIAPDEVYFDPEEETEILRHLIRNYTFEAGVRDLERIIRTLFLRVQRKEIMGEGKRDVKLTLGKVKKYLEEPIRPRLINEDDRVGEMMGLGVNMEMGIGSLIPIQVTPITQSTERNDQRSYMSMVHTTGNIEKVMDESRKVASTAILHRSKELDIDAGRMTIPVHLHFMGGSSKKDGPSAGGAIALALASLFKNRKIRRDIAMTGEVDTQGRITSIGGIGVKLETAYAAGCKTLIIPRENLYGNDGIERLPEALKQELQVLTFQEWKSNHTPFDYTRHVLQVIAVEDIVEAAEVAFLDEGEIDSLYGAFEEHAARAAEELGRNDAAPFKKLRMIYLDSPEEANPDILESGFCGQDYGCIILVGSDVRNEIMEKLPDLGGKLMTVDFDPSSQRLLDLINEYKREYTGPGNPPLRMSVIAPLSFLRREGIRSSDFTTGVSFAGIRFFASCCTVENMQIHECRNLIAEAYLHLAKLSDELLRDCPFLVEKDGIYGASVAFIPEKYRLDVRRAEEILDRGISVWMKIMEGKSEEAAREIPRVGKV